MVLRERTAPRPDSERAPSVIGGTVMGATRSSVTVDGGSMVLPQKKFMLLYKMRGGLIRMRLIEEDGSVLFTIDNEGKSIPDEDKSRIFNKFYQGDSSHESEGNGLGLALCARSSPSTAARSGSKTR